jgi:hypothetical protein
MGEIGLTGRPPSRYIPRADSFYIRALIREVFGVEMSVCRVEALMIEEGMYILNQRRGTVRRSRAHTLLFADPPTSGLDDPGEP